MPTSAQLGKFNILGVSGPGLPPSITGVVESKTSSATLNPGSGGTQLIDASASSVTITLPIAASATNKVYNIKKIDGSANVVTVAASGAETIDGVNTKLLITQYQSISVQSNGVQWYVI